MTREEEIIRMLKKLETNSRRNPMLRPLDKPECPDDPPPDAGHHGRGRVLAALNDCGSMSQTQLAAHLDIRPQSLSEMLCKVEADGLVSRKQSEEDKRQTIVSLTEEGKARVAGFREAHRRRAEEFLSPLTEDEKAVLASILEKLIGTGRAEQTGTSAEPEKK